MLSRGIKQVFPQVRQIHFFSTHHEPTPTKLPKVTQTVYSFPKPASISTSKTNSIWSKRCQPLWENPFSMQSTEWKCNLSRSRSATDMILPTDLTFVLTTTIPLVQSAQVAESSSKTTGLKESTQRPTATTSMSRFCWTVQCWISRAIPDWPAAFQLRLGWRDWPATLTRIPTKARNCWSSDQ